MTKTLFIRAAWPVIALLTAGLAACGGGDDGGNSGGAISATSPANIQSPDDAAALTAAFFALGEIAAGEGASTQKQHAVSMAKGGAIRAQAVTTEDCGAGGTQTFDDETGRTEYDNCRETNGESDLLLDGVETAACTAGGASANTDCMGDFTDILGESGTPLLFRTTSPDFDLTLTLLATIRERFGASSNRTDIDGNFTVRADDAPTITVVFDALTFVDDSSMGVDTITIDGGFGTDAGERFNCGAGLVTYDTVSPITLDNDGAPISGQVNLSSANGGAAQVTFNSDGSATVTVGGNMQTYSQSQLFQLCNG